MSNNNLNWGDEPEEVENASTNGDDQKDANEDDNNLEGH